MIEPKQITVLDHTITDLTNREVRTKRDVWIGFGPDPYPDKDMDDPVLLLEYDARFRIEGITTDHLSPGDVVQALDRLWLVNTVRQHFGPVCYQWFQAENFGQPLGATPL